MKVSRPISPIFNHKFGCHGIERSEKVAQISNLRPNAYNIWGCVKMGRKRQKGKVSDERNGLIVYYKITAFSVL